MAVTVLRTYDLSGLYLPLQEQHKTIGDAKRKWKSQF